MKLMIRKRLLNFRECVLLRFDAGRKIAPPADWRSSSRWRSRPGQRDLRRWPAARPARLSGAGVVGRLRARSLVAPRTGKNGEPL